MINEDKIKQLLQQTKGFSDLAVEYEDEEIKNINHTIYDSILNEIGIESNLNDREDYYEIFVQYDFGFIDADSVINRIKIKKND